MDANELNDLIECPNCGAQLPPGDGHSRTCQYCETTYRATPAPPQPMAVPPNLGGWSTTTFTADATSLDRTAGSAAKASAGCGLGTLVITLIIIAAVAVPIFAVTRSGGFGGLAVFKDAPDGKMALLPPKSPGAPLTIFTMLRTSGGDTQYKLARFDTNNGSPVWTSTPLTAGTSASQAPILTDGERVYVPDKERVVAFKVSDGTLAWQANLSDEGPTSCAECFLLAGTQLVVKAKDNSITSFHTADGKVGWSKPAGRTSAKTQPYGDKVLLLDDDEKHNGFLVLVDADGAESAKTQPTCQVSSITETFSTSSAIIAIPDQNALVVGFGSPYPCWQRLDMTTGTTTWAKTYKDDDTVDDLGTQSGLARVVEGSRAVLSNGDVVAALALETGEFTPLPATPNLRRVPVALGETRVILRTKTGSGTAKYGFQAVDLASGAVAWEVPLGTAEPADPPEAETIFLSKGDSRFTANLDGGTFRILVFDHDSRDFRFDNVTVATGAEAKSTVPSNISGSLPHFVSGGWVGPQAVVQSDTYSLVVTNAATAKIEYQYP